MDDGIRIGFFGNLHRQIRVINFSVMYISTMEIQVTYGDTDMMGIIYHANYLRWFELGRTRLIEEVGFSYAEMENAGYCSPVLQVEITYKKPVRYGDRVFVKTWVEENLGHKTTYGYEIVNGEGTLCATGFTQHTILRKESFKPIRFIHHFPEWFQKYEAIKRICGDLLPLKRINSNKNKCL